MSLILLALAVLESTPAAVAAAPPMSADVPPQVITNPDWLKRPSAANMYQVWPGGAYYAHVSGRVVLQCIVNEKGRLKRCEPVEEEPSGWGFGDAAKEMAAQFQMKPMTRDGEPVAGARVRIPLNFIYAGDKRSR